MRSTAAMPRSIPAVMLLASIAGIHCGSDYGAVPGDGSDPAAASEAPPPPAHAASPSDDTSNDGPSLRTLAIGKLPATMIQSTVYGDDGAMYATGTFSGTLLVGNESFRSKGLDDVFLVRFDPDGRIAWTHAVGSTEMESGPRVSFVNGSVRLLAKTQGDVDCGTGSMGYWDSPMFFYCVFRNDGQVMAGATFPISP